MNRKEAVENLEKTMKKAALSSVICSWCNQTIIKKKGKGTTHTICVECAKKIEKGEE